MLELAQLFLSLQGEGPFAGRPAVFVRLSHCIEPYCPWCDTRFAWENGEKIPFDTLIERIEQFAVKFVVITGGEPFLQWNEGLNDLENTLLDRGFKIQYETSGKICIPKETQAYIVCSPKWLKGKWWYDEQNNNRANAFKFVVQNDFDSVIAFVRKQKISPEKVWIMPMGTTKEEQLRRMPDIWQLCVEQGFNFTPRLHILAFDNKAEV